MAALNAQSIKSDNMAYKRHEIATFIYDNAINIMYVTETWLSKGEDSKKDELAPCGYTAESFPRPSGLAGGGIAIIYRNSLCKQLNIKQNFSFSHSSFQLVQSTLTLQQGALHLFCLYRPPPSSKNRLKDSMFTEQLPDFLEYANNLHGHVCFCGDANIHFDQCHESLVKKTVELLSLHNFKQIVSMPTHKKGHILDWTVIRDDDDDFHVSTVVTDALESDHCCVLSLFNVSLTNHFPRAA